MMLTLYYMDYCPYCKRVIEVIRNRKVSVTYKDLDTNQKFRKELISGGGKKQVPCLLVAKKGQDDQWLYESEDIINFIQSHY